MYDSMYVMSAKLIVYGGYETNAVFFNVGFML